MKNPKPVPPVRCPKCGEEIPARLLRRKAAAIIGSKGGQATGASKVRDHKTLSEAATRRWARWREENGRKAKA